jgi:hypothetical protein
VERGEHAYHVTKPAIDRRTYGCHGTENLQRFVKNETGSEISYCVRECIGTKDVRGSFKRFPESLYF